jgi:glycosyltransferase involved in cell wall biosynthesis
VLPLHNAERTMRTLVTSILDLATAPARRLQVAVVDDGSTDETYETACELARDYPQVQVFRQRVQSGVGPALAEVRRRLLVDEAIVYDGVGRVDLAELAALIHPSTDGACPAADDDGPGSAGGRRGSRRFAAVASLNSQMVAAHRAVAAFQWLRLPEPARSRRAGAQTPRPANNRPQIAPLVPVTANASAASMPVALH